MLYQKHITTSGVLSRKIVQILKKAPFFHDVLFETIEIDPPREANTKIPLKAENDHGSLGGFLSFYLGWIRRVFPSVILNYKENDTDLLLKRGQSDESDVEGVNKL